MNLKTLFNSHWENDFKDCDILGIQNDSRLVINGDLFLAYPGSGIDGRLFIDEAISKGAIAIAFEPLHCPDNLVIPLHIPCIPIAGLAEKLGAIARFFYNPSDVHLITTGITGTNGKTTIAYQLAQAHSLLGQKTAYVGTIGQGDVNSLHAQNNTTPDALCLQKLLNTYRNQDFKRVCMEVSSHALIQNRVAQIHFKQAIFTNLTLDHLDYHHSMENYAAAKARLFSHEFLEYAIINQDDPFQQIMVESLKPQVKKFSFGIHKSSDVQALDWKMDINGTQVQVRTPWGLHQLNFQAVGEFNIYNNLAIFCSLILDGYPIPDVIQVMKELKSAPGRLEVVSQSPYVLIDYAHTPDALLNVLNTLSQLKKGRLWVVFGCGGDRDTSKRSLMGHIASVSADNIIITSDNPRNENPQLIIDQIKSGIKLNTNSVVELINRREAVTYALEHANSEDIILIAGKGHETYQQIGTIRENFSDKQVVKDFYNAKSVNSSL